MKVLNIAFLTSLISFSAFSTPTLALKDFNPVVISSTPKVGSDKVSPFVKEIEIKFSKPMMTNRMWSVVKLKNSVYPMITGDVYFREDARTFVIPVKLKSNTVYGFSINSDTHNGFRDKDGKPAQPYFVSFKTASGA